MSDVQIVRIVECVPTNTSFQEPVVSNTNPEITTLLQCPFCGGNAEYIDDFFGKGFMSAVACTNCDAAIVSTSSFAIEKVDLINQWNTRSTTKE